MLQISQGITQAGARLMSRDWNERHPKDDGRWALVTGWQCVVHHGKDTPGVLLLRGHLPHRGVGAPVIQYFGVDECDREEGHPIIDAQDGIPIHGEVIVHNSWESSQKHGRQELCKLVPFAKVGGNLSVGFMKL